MKRVIALLLLMLMLFSTGIQAFAAVETNAASWAKAAVEKAYAEGFLPESYLQRATQEITRLEFAKIAVLFYEKITGKDVQAEKASPFGDCDDPDVIAAYEAGIIGGKEAGVFAPNESLTREQMAIMVARTLKVCGLDLSGMQKKNPFSDTATLYAESQDYIDMLFGTKIISGYEDNTFAPFRKLTTQEAVSCFVRAWDYYQNNLGEGTSQVPIEPTKPTEPQIPESEKEDETEGLHSSDYRTVAVAGKTLQLGQSVAEVKALFGEPDRVDETIYGLQRLVYLEDYTSYFFVTVDKEQVIEFFTPCKEFTYMETKGTGTSADIKNLDYVSVAEHSGIIKSEESEARFLLDFEGNISGLLLQTKEFATTDKLRSGLHTSLRENLEQELLDFIQIKRKEASLPLLTENAKLSVVALEHSNDMVKKDYFDYNSPTGSTPFSRIQEKLMTFTTATEIIAQQRGDTVQVYLEWVKTTARMNAILDQSMDQIGIGIAQKNKTLYVTVDFCGGLKDI